MITTFLKLEKKQFFRSSYWQKSIVLNIVLVLFALYFVVSFSFLGFFAFQIINKVAPEQDPLHIVNKVLLLVFFGDLIFRYLMQKLPVMNIKPFLYIPIKKNILVHYVLIKSTVSFFNIITLFFFVPFSIQLLLKEYNTASVLGWLFAIVCIILSINFVNFLINKNNKAFAGIAGALGVLVLLNHFEILPVTVYSEIIFNSVFDNPLYALLFIPILILIYRANVKNLSQKVYLDDAVNAKVKEVNSVDLSWTDRLGDLAPFLKNDIRLIWRNKRPRTVFLLAFAFVFYGLLFFTDDTYKNNMSVMLIFAAIFVTGGFVINFGQFIPSWDSAHYKMLMSQNIRYRKYLESKWLLMVVTTVVLYFLSIPYLYFGIDTFLMVTAGAIYNIGFNSLFLLYAGSFNRKHIDLNKSGFGNTQGTSATQFIIVLPLLVLPMLLFWAFNSLLGFNAGVIAIAVAGTLSLLLKKYCMDFIVNKYISDKYATLHAFGQST